MFFIAPGQSQDPVLLCTTPITFYHGVLAYAVIFFTQSEGAAWTTPPVHVTEDPSSAATVEAISLIIKDIYYPEIKRTYHKHFLLYRLRLITLVSSSSTSVVGIALGNPFVFL